MTIWEKTKVLILNDDDGLVTDMFKKRGTITTTIITGSDITSSFISLFDFIVLTGGTDISPFIYGNERRGETDVADSKRDVFEVSVIQIAIANGVGLVGICRGAQLLSSHLGGTIDQHDVSGDHLSSHDIILEEKVLGLSVLENYSANHHQLFYPPKSMDVIGYNNDVCEIAIHPSYGVLAFQPHPEWEESESDNQRVFFEMVKEYCI